MRITIVLQPHLYAENKLMDWIFNKPSCILPDNLFRALKTHRNYKFEIEINKDTTIADVLDYITGIIVGVIENDIDFCYDLVRKCVCFKVLEERYYPEKQDAHFEYLLKRYLDPHETNTVYTEILVNVDAGRLLMEDSLLFYMHSHEGNKHNEPHVHVSDIQSNSRVTIALSDHRVLAGNLPSKKLKKAKEIIREKQQFFNNCWITKTDGLVPDINHHLGLIDY